MAGTHEENMKDPAWLTEQMTRYKQLLAELQGKHDAQLKGIAEDKATIASLNDALAEAKSKASGYESTIAALTTANGDLSEEVAELNGKIAEQSNQITAAQSLAKSRRTGLAQLANIIAPLLAAE